jgi:hypothetical protein
MNIALSGMEHYKISDLASMLFFLFCPGGFDLSHFDWVSKIVMVHALVSKIPDMEK